MILGLSEGDYMGDVWTDITVPDNSHRVAHTLAEVEQVLDDIARKDAEQAISKLGFNQLETKGQ